MRFDQVEGVRSSCSARYSDASHPLLAELESSRIDAIPARKGGRSAKGSTIRSAVTVACRPGTTEMFLSIIYGNWPTSLPKLAKLMKGTL